MSDINIILDGLIAFMVAAAFSILLLLGIIACLIYAWSRASRTSGPINRQPLFPHITGISISLACFAAVLLLLLYTERTPRPHTLSRWLDAWVWVWSLALLALWPLWVHVHRKRQGRDSL
ncbi:MAG: hypothetical protein ICV60_20835 [Pyrinomonadaceae bacterium]|nr:hypothetical protein [Pyrinomonadaceae bacterium]